uniref:NADH dehydrogenase [ubiquinone] 1 alpha subcomplex subunit 13 n=1 Tax=Syphacia muris TaxID=451379 RepID=A0A0N5A935_9BILA
MILYGLNYSKLLYFPKKCVFIRSFFGKKKPPIQPPPALKQVKPPPGVKGHFKYERYWSDNPKLVPQIGDQANTLKNFLFGGIREHYEIYPFFFLGFVYVVVTSIFLYCTFHTIEVRSPKARSWKVIRDKYWKFHTVIYDIFGTTHERFPLMEQLLDEIEEAAEKRRLEDEEREEAMRQYLPVERKRFAFWR